MENWRFWTNISVNFENGKRCSHSYNGRRIGTRMRSITWCHLYVMSDVAILSENKCSLLFRCVIESPGDPMKDDVTVGGLA